MAQSELALMLRKSKNTVFFGGAGISTESGIPDFRSADGLYSSLYKRKIPPETILSASFFHAHTEEFYDFYRANMIFPNARPNSAHTSLARLEAAGLLSCVITQNIDGLHQAAGSKNVIELHGSVLRNHCMKCKRRFGLDFIIKSTGVPHCPHCGGIVRPDVTLYEEQLPEGAFEAAIDAVSRAELFIIGGTSLSVYPAAGLIDFFTGGYIAIINYSATPSDRRATLVIHDSAGKVLTEAADELI